MKTTNKIILFGLMVIIFIVLCSFVHNMIILFNLFPENDLMKIQEFFNTAFVLLLNGISLLLFIIVAKKINRELISE